MDPTYERYRSAAREYPGLQGLRMIPIGLIILAFAPRFVNNQWLGGQGDCTYTLPMLVAACIAWFVVGRYYTRTFGKVTPRLHPRRQWIWGSGMAALLIVAIVLENVFYRFNNNLALSPTQVYLAGLYLVSGIVYRYWYNTLFGGIIAGASLLPLLTGTTVAHPLYGTFGLVFSIVFGLGIILTGLLAHLRLVRYFRPAEGGSHVRFE